MVNWQYLSLGYLEQNYFFQKVYFEVFKLVANLLCLDEHIDVSDRG